MTLELLGIQFGYNHYVLKANTSGLSHEECLRSPESGGNCLNWVFGHILATRNGILSVLREDSIWTKEEADRYRRGSEPIKDEENAIPLEKMLSDLDVSQQRVMSGLSRFDPDQLSEPAPFSPINREGETVGSLLAGLVFHEAYHAGQIGLLRRIVGKPGTLT